MSNKVQQKGKNEKQRKKNQSKQSITETAGILERVYRDKVVEKEN